MTVASFINDSTITKTETTSSIVLKRAASANGKNPLAIIIPCHRVVGADGKLTGYAGGLHRKQWLLEHESKAAGKQSTLF